MMNSLMTSTLHATRCGVPAGLGGVPPEGQEDEEQQQGGWKRGLLGAEEIEALEVRGRRLRAAAVAAAAAADAAAPLLCSADLQVGVCVCGGGGAWGGGGGVLGCRGGGVVAGRVVVGWVMLRAHGAWLGRRGEQRSVAACM